MSRQPILVEPMSGLTVASARRTPLAAVLVILPAVVLSASPARLHRERP